MLHAVEARLIGNDASRGGETRGRVGGEEIESERPSAVGLFFAFCVQSPGLDLCNFRYQFLPVRYYC